MSSSRKDFRLKCLSFLLAIVVMLPIGLIPVTAATGVLRQDEALSFQVIFPECSRSVSHAEILTSVGLMKCYSEGNLRLTSESNTPHGVVTRYVQHYRGIPVTGGSIVIRTSSDGTPRLISGSIAKWSEETDPVYNISSGNALNIAVRHVNPASLRGDVTVQRVVLPENGKPHFCWRVDIPALSPLGDWEVYIDGRNGSIMLIENRLRFLDGAGLVFDPDPITASGDTSLHDQDDDADAVPEEAYSEVVLFDLTQDDDELYILSGRWVDTSPTENRARMEDPEFSFDREDDRFEEVMAYYHIDRQARYIRTLGFEKLPPSSQPVNVNGVAEDISFFSPQTGVITTGSGGVDDAEDADVLLHEYGHSLMHRVVPDLRGNDSDLLAEGFCDYLAGDRSLETAPDFQTYILFNWDGHNEFWDGRILNSDITFPEALELDAHQAGQLWSSLLTEIRLASGRRDLWNSVVIDHLYSLPDSATVPFAAAALLESDRHIADYSFRQLIVNGCEQRAILPAGMYRPSLTHQPLRDREDVNRSSRVMVAVDSDFSLDPDRLWLVFDIDGEHQDSVSLHRLNDNPRSFVGYIPAPREEADISYFIQAFDTCDVFSTHPTGAPFERHSFHIGSDHVPPVITQLDSLPDSVFPDGEITIGTRVIDNIVVDDVSLIWYWGDMMPGGVISLVRSQLDSTLFTGRFRWSLQEPEVIHYMILAVDGSEGRNTASSSIRSFAVRPEALVDNFEEENLRWNLIGWHRSDQAAAHGDFCLTDRLENHGYMLPREAFAQVDAVWDFSRFDRARVRFWEMHGFDFDAEEIGVLEIREVDDENWQELMRFTGVQDWWRLRTIDLTDYCEGRSAPVWLRFRTTTPAEADQTTGWQIDELHLETGSIVSADEPVEQIPGGIYLSSIFPNPANDRLMFSYYLPSNGIVDLLDISGRHNLRFNLPQGTGYSSIDLHNLPAGMYLLRLSSSSRQETRRIILVK